MSSPSPYGPRPTTPLPVAPAGAPPVPLAVRVEVGAAVRAAIGWCFGSGILCGAVIGVIALAAGALLNELGGYDDKDLSPWWAVAVFAGATVAATALASLIVVPVLLLLRRNAGFAAMSAVAQGIVAWLAGWIPFGVLLALVFFVLPAFDRTG